MPNSLIGKRLEAIKKNLGYNTQQEFAEAIDIKRSTLANLLSGHRDPSREMLNRIIDKLGVNGHYLLTGEGEMFITPSPTYSKDNGFCNKTVCVAVEGEIAAGEPEDGNYDEPLDHIDIDEHLVPWGDTICLRVSGNSMAPEIENGDLVFIRKSTDWFSYDGKICAVWFEGGATLKRVSLNEATQTIVLLPLNHTYKPIIVEPDHSEGCSMIGPMVLHIKRYMS